MFLLKTAIVMSIFCLARGAIFFSYYFLNRHSLRFSSHSFATFNCSLKQSSLMTMTRVMAFLKESNATVSTGMISRLVKVNENFWMAKWSSTSLTPNPSFLHWFRRDFVNQVDGMVGDNQLGSPFKTG